MLVTFTPPPAPAEPPVVGMSPSPFTAAKSTSGPLADSGNGPLYSSYPACGSAASLLRTAAAASTCGIDAGNTTDGTNVPAAQTKMVWVVL